MNWQAEKSEGDTSCHISTRKFSIVRMFTKQTFDEIAFKSNWTISSYFNFNWLHQIGEKAKFWHDLFKDGRLISKLKLSMS